jgi:transposase InsO family protein
VDAFAASIPPCDHTAQTDGTLEDMVDELMLSCSAVLTRSKARQIERQAPATETKPNEDPKDIGMDILRDIGNLQLTDPDIATIMQLKLNGSDYPTFREISAESLSVKALRQHWRNLFVSNGVLYRRLVVEDRNSKVQIALPRSLRTQILERLHSDPTAGHLGTAKTIERVKARFYWIGWRRDTMRFVSHCHTCNVVKRPHKKVRPPLTQQLFGEAFERVSIDLIGPLKVTPRGYRYVVTMEDNFTKWVEATPLRTMETEEICNAIIRDFISRFGCMYILHSDRGAQFVSQLYGSLMRKLGVDRTLTTAYNPKSNGLIENFNKTLKSMMKTYVEDHRESVGSWDLMLPIFLMAYRSSVHSSTGETPHFMLTAREMKLPLDLLYTTPSEEKADVPSYVTDIQSKFHKAFALVRENLKNAQRIQKKQYETSVPKYQALKAGDTVWYFNARKSFKGDKHRPWLGPYLVRQLNEDFTVILQVDEKGKTIRTHADKLRPAPGASLEKWCHAN